MFSRLGTAGLVTDEELLHARENYRPSTVVPTGEMAFAHWTERVQANSDTVVSRELAGLSEEQLENLASEFSRSPRRRKPPVLQHYAKVGAALVGLSALCALAEAMTPGKAVGMTAWIAAALVFTVGAVIAFCAGSLASMRFVPTEMAHGKLGLLVGELNEQHPWLYRVYLLQRHPAAASYRQRVLSERGRLRGVDYIMMREVSDRHDGLELTRTAREVAAAVQARD